MKHATVDEYIAAFPPDVRAILRRIRATIRKAAPLAKERISYGMPSFAQDGVLVYYAAFKNHIGLYPPVRAETKLRQEICEIREREGKSEIPARRTDPICVDRPDRQSAFARESCRG